MSKLPLDDEETGIHRAKIWEIGMYALNNTSTNTYMLLVGSISYYLIGIVGVATVLAGSIVTLMRVWDGITDPFIGMLVDKTNGKLGKNRPFIIIGQIILFCTTFAMFRFVPHMPTAIRFIAFMIIYILYIIGYTCQCVVTKSAQTCLTNDPKQRPIFTMFDATYNTLLMGVFFPIYLTGTLVPKFTISAATAEGAAKIAELVAQNPALEACLSARNGIQTLSAFYNPEMWNHFQLVFAAIAFVFATCAIIALWRKDRPKYFGTGVASKIGFKDYIDVIAHNRAIQMLIVAASTDKIAMLAVGNTTIMICLFGIVCGNFGLYSSYSAITSIPVVLITIFGVNQFARKLGQRKALVIGSVGAMIFAVLIGLLLVLGVPTTMKLPQFSLTRLSTWANLFKTGHWSLFGVTFVVLYMFMKGCSNLAGNIVIPMTADCADYEVYRSGRYVPGLMGTLFSLVDKLISSISTTIIAVIFAAIGFGKALPTVETPYSSNILVAVLICYLGLPIIGWVCNLIAMKFYPLTKEKMEEIQGEIARIKKEALAKQGE